MTLDYFYGQVGELFSFYRIPKALFLESRFQNLSTDAKTLYGILLDRMSLSAKNGWLDEQGRVFIIFTIEDVKRALCCADNKATKLLRELEEFGLIERKRRGLGRPSLVYQIVLRGELSYPVPLGDDPRGNIVRLDNAIGNFADRIADADAALDSLEQQKQAAEVEIAKPFAQEEELQTKSARLAELDALLNMEHQSSRTEPEAEEKPDARPSVLAALEEKADKVEPVRPFKSYLDKDGDAR